MGEEEEFSAGSMTHPVLKHLPGIMCVLNTEGEILEANDHFRQEFQFPRSGGNHYVQFLSEASLEKANRSFERVFEDGRAEEELVLKNHLGEEIPYLLSGVLISIDGSPHVVATGLDIRIRVEAEQTLRRERQFIEKALNSLPGLFYVLDDQGRYIRVNNGFIEQLGYSWEEVQRMNPMDFYLEEDREAVARAVEEAFAKGSAQVTSRVRAKSGELPWYFMTGVHFEQDGKNFILGTGIDISEQIRLENESRDSLREKEVLLSEVHHRVKNNLALVSGLMQIQAFQTEDPTVLNYLNDNQSRIKSIALIHEQLYQNQDFASIQLSEQIRRLLDHVSGFVQGEAVVETSLSLEEVTLTINQALPLTLILNELFTNAYKHAFRGRSKGKVTVELSENGGQIHMVVFDDGVGLPEGVTQESSHGLGLTLLNTLTKQLSGELDLTSGTDGTRIELRFEKDDRLRGVASHSV